MSTKRPRVDKFLDLEAAEANPSESSEDDQSLEDFIVPDNDSETVFAESICDDFGREEDEEAEEEEIREAVARAKKLAARDSWLKNLGQESAGDSEHLASRIQPMGLNLYKVIVQGRTQAKWAKDLNLQYKSLEKKQEKFDKEGSEKGAFLDDDRKPIIPIPLFEAFHVENLHGQLFVATDNIRAIQKNLTPYNFDKTIFDRISQIHLPEGCFTGFSTSTLEYLRKDHSSDIRKDEWVRVSSGLYRGDLAMVLMSEPLNLVVIPRFDQLTYAATHLGSEIAIAQAQETKRKGLKKRKRRPEARLLSEEIYEHMPPKYIGRACGKRLFYEGLEVISPKPKNLDRHPKITDDEIQPFLNIEASMPAAINYIRRSRKSSWHKGDVVYILEGECTGMTGTIQEFNSSDFSVTVSLISDDESSGGLPRTTLNWDMVRQHFSVGKWVRIGWGTHKGRYGAVIRETRGRKGIVEIWSPAQNVREQGRDEHKRKSREEEEQDARTAKMDTVREKREEIGEELLTFQDFLEEYLAAPSFEGLKHPNAPGTVSSSFTMYSQFRLEGDRTEPAIRQTELEAAYRCLPHQDGTTAPPVVETTRIVLPVGSGFEFEHVDKYYIKNCHKPDKNLGKEAAIIKGVLKGYRGQILDIVDIRVGGQFVRGNVKIGLPGRYPPFVTVPCTHAMLLDRPDVDLAGNEIKRNVPGTAPLHSASAIVPSAPLPECFPTPQPDPPSAETKEVDLRDGIFLMDPAIGRFSLCRIWVGFQFEFDGGRLGNRNAVTDENPLDNLDCSGDAFDLNVSPKIWVTYTDNHSSQPKRRLVPVAMLKPAFPSSSGVEVLVIKKDSLYYGRRGKVVKASRKDKTVMVEFPISTKAEKFAMCDLCKVSTEDPFSS